MRALWWINESAHLPVQDSPTSGTWVQASGSLCRLGRAWQPGSSELAAVVRAALPSSVSHSL